MRIWELYLVEGQTHRICRKGSLKFSLKASTLTYHTPPIHSPCSWYSYLSKSKCKYVVHLYKALYWWNRDALAWKNWSSTKRTCSKCPWNLYLNYKEQRLVARTSELLATSYSAAILPGMCDLCPFSQGNWPFCSLHL